MATKVVVERKRVCYGPAEKFKQWRVLAVKGTVVKTMPSLARNKPHCLQNTKPMVGMVFSLQNLPPACV
jgi:hypothetical protein